MSYRVNVIEEKIRTKLDRFRNVGQTEVMNALNKITSEFNIRQDVLAPAGAFKYDLGDKGQIIYAVGDAPVQYTDFAFRQLLEKIGLDKRFADKLAQDSGQWSKELLIHNLRTLTDHNINRDKLLVRRVGNQVKGVLSDSYKRIDFSPVAETFVTEGLRAGFLPFAGTSTETRYNLKMLHPQVYAPTEHEVICMGVDLKSSDYGNGAFCISLFVARILCVNLHVSETISRKVHIGSRAGDDFQYSQRTYELDTKAMQSAVKDVMTIGLEDRAEKVCQFIELASKREVTDEKAKSVFDQLRKQGAITKEEAVNAGTMYETLDEVTLLPQEKSAWWLANVISLMAKGDKMAGDKKLDLERTAYDLFKTA